MRRTIIETHDEIMSIIRHMFLKNTCVAISNVSSELKIDRRTIVRHLKLAEIDNVGHFIDCSKEIFCKNGK